MKLPEVGKTYSLRHSRFGKATVRILNVMPDADPDDVWYDVEVIKGELRGVGAGSVRGPGEEKRVRAIHCWLIALDTPLAIE